MALTFGIHIGHMGGPLGGRGEKRTLWAAARNDPRGGFLRGTPDQVMDLLAGFRDAGCQRVNIAFRERPYDWDALHAFAERVLPAFGARRE